ncbi:MAG TPA: DivIVA domain-containing protein [Candidatus Krumholzibacteria bacterium]|nr:DivIVA domain-containing protein [Candidatus Krumholzibacteria bacterium]
MRITPLDARKQEFRKAVRGYDCDEVRAFLSTLADEYETVLVDNKQLRERLMEQEDKIGEYKTMERTLRDTLMTAERLMQDSRESAGKESELIVRDAQLKARQILEECRVRTEEMRREMGNLRKEKENYLARFKSLAEAQIQFIENHRQDFKDIDRRIIDMVDTVMGTVGGAAAQPKAAVHDQPQAAPRPAARPAAPAWTNPVAGSHDEDEAPVEQAAPAASAEPDMWRDWQPASAPKSAPAQAAHPVAEANPWSTAGWGDKDADTQAETVAEEVDAALADADEADEAISALHEDQDKPQPAAVW